MLGMRRGCRIGFILAVSAFLSFLSCSTGRDNKSGYAFPIFTQEFYGDFELIGEPLSDYGYVESLTPYKDKLILSAYNPRDGRYIHILDKVTGETVASGALRGRGQGEILYVPRTSLIGDALYLYDVYSNVTTVYDLSRLETPIRFVSKSSEPFKSPIFVKYGSVGKIVLSNASFVHSDSVSVRLTLQREQKQWEYDEYPVEDRRLTWLM